MSIPTTHYEFDAIIDRTNTNSAKWDLYPGCVPLSVAEMEFPLAPEILNALQARIEHPFFGYIGTPDELRELIVQRMQERYNWTIQPEHLLFCPGMISLAKAAVRAIGKPGDGILVDAPTYGPFLTIPATQGRFAQFVDMTRTDSENTMRYGLDFDAIESAITDQTAAYLFCNPHNPAGRAFSVEELRRVAEICLKHDLVILSDDIHCEVTVGDVPYTPFATLSPEIENQTVTMMSMTKSFNLAGVPCTFAIVPNEDLRERISKALLEASLYVKIFGYTVMTAAYRDAGEWQKASLEYIRANRAYYLDFMRENLPMLKTTVPEATYLAWIDCSALNIPEEYESPREYFLKEAEVALNAGTFFGKGYNDYVRLNFACPRSMLEDGLTRLKAAVDKLG